MRYSAAHSQATRARILAAAGRTFRREGYGAAGIDGLTKAAAVTNGAFYGHFRNKAAAFRAAVVEGLDDLRANVAAARQQPESWLKRFVALYLGPKRACELGEACALPTLSPDVMRADHETRVVYERALRDVVAEVAAGFEGGSESAREEGAIVLLALLSGGLTMARAVADQSFSDRIAAAVERHALDAFEGLGNR